MSHENKNKLLSLYFKEGNKFRQKRILKHALSCETCREYLSTLENTERFLTAWQEEKPDPHTFDRILNRIPEVQKRPVPSRQTYSFSPLAGIAAAIAFIMAILYFVQSGLTRLPFWKALEDWWLVQAVGSFGLTVILFFILSAFVVLSLAPFLYFNTHKNGSYP